ncbi:MAG TPA: lysine--tRNA ligase [Euryarchaeota archaeon]|nr:lysine--tRNA ligase [Euryarchaeota archaeon]
MHWADVTAERVVGERGDKERYAVESGITPSGTVHAGNFRELFTVWAVAKALRSRGKEVRVIHFWDDYDRFRKVPKNVPSEWEEYIGMPVAEVPDPWGCHRSYAHHFMDKFEEEIAGLGIEVEFLHAAELYRSGFFEGELRTALGKREKIREILNRVREQAKQEPLPGNWWPVYVYCERCRKDFTDITAFDGERVHYRCRNCGHEGETPLREGNVKMRWRVDWPARWYRLGIDFEPGGKDHLAAGSSYDTGKDIVKEVFGAEPPVTLMYEFVSVKGQKGKMSGSKGDAITLSELLEVMEPELILFYYGRYRPSKEIKLDLGLGLVKQYDEFDRTEEAYWEGEEYDGDLLRAYWMAMEPMPEKKPVRVAFSTLVNLVQLPGMDGRKLKETLVRMGKIGEEISREDWQGVLNRAERARNWLDRYAPESVKFRILDVLPDVDVPEDVRKGLEEVAKAVEKGVSEEELNTVLFETAKKVSSPKEFFPWIYRLFIGKERGPRAAGLLLSLDREFVVRRLRLEE